MIHNGTSIELCETLWFYYECVFYSHQLTVVGKLVSLMTDNNAVELFLLYCMRQMSIVLASECNPPCDEELLLTTMLSVLKVNEFCNNLLTVYMEIKCIK